MRTVTGAVSRQNSAPNMPYTELRAKNPTHFACCKLSNAVAVIRIGRRIGSNLLPVFKPAVFSLTACAYENITAKSFCKLNRFKLVFNIIRLQEHIVPILTVRACPRKMKESIIFFIIFILKIRHFIKRAICNFNKRV